MAKRATRILPAHYLSVLEVTQLPPQISASHPTPKSKPPFLGGREGSMGGGQNEQMAPGPRGGPPSGCVPLPGLWLWADFSAVQAAWQCWRRWGGAVSPEVSLPHMTAAPHRNVFWSSEASKQMRPGGCGRHNKPPGQICPPFPASSGSSPANSAAFSCLTPTYPHAAHHPLPAHGPRSGAPSWVELVPTPLTP